MEVHYTGLTAEEPWPWWGLREDCRDDFIHRALGFEVIGDGFGDGELAGPVWWQCPESSIDRHRSATAC